MNVLYEWCDTVEVKLNTSIDGTENFISHYPLWHLVLTRANLIGTWGLRRHAVDVAPDGMGWEWG